MQNGLWVEKWVSWADAWPLLLDFGTHITYIVLLCLVDWLILNTFGYINGKLMNL
jgi:hypothetical protein